MKSTVTESASETEAVGAELADQLSYGDIVLIKGDLGAGKTTFVRGVLTELGVKDPVTSPTFAIGSLYTVAGREFAHLDLYRFNGFSGEDPSLLDEYFADGSTVFIEWPERVSEAELSQLSAASFEVKIEHSGDNRRQIVVRRLK